MNYNENAVMFHVFFKHLLYCEAVIQHLKYYYYYSHYKYFKHNCQHIIICAMYMCLCISVCILIYFLITYI